MLRSLLLALGIALCPVANAEILTNGLFSAVNGFESYRVLEADGIRLSGASSPDGIAGHIERVIDPIYPSRYVAKSTITRDDGIIAGGLRSEFSGNEDPFHTERWYGFGFLIPSDWSSTKNSISLFQVHDRADTDESGFRYATFHMEINPVDVVKIWNAYDPDRVTSPPEVHPTANVDYVHRQLGEFQVSRDQWTYIVVNVQWAADNTGFMNIWKDGDLIFEESDHINTYNDIRGPWFKAGTYASALSTGWTELSSYSTGVVVGDSGESLNSIMHLLQAQTLPQVPAVPEVDSLFLFLSGLPLLLWFGRSSHWGFAIGRECAGAGAETPSMDVRDVVRRHSTWGSAAIRARVPQANHRP